MGDQAGSAIGTGLSSRGRKVVVVCLGGDAASLQPALDMLTARGFEVTCCQGQDVRPPAMVEQAQRHGPDALYVLAMLSKLPEAELVPLEAALRNAQVPAKHLSELDVDWRDPMALVEHVRTIDRTLAGSSPAKEETAPPVVRASAPSPSAGTREQTGPQRTIALVPAGSQTGPQRTIAPSQQQTAPHRTVPAAPKQATGPQRTLPPPSRETTGPQRTLPPPPRDDTGPKRTVAVAVVPPAQPARAKTSAKPPETVPAEATSTEPAFPAPQAMPSPPVATPAAEAVTPPIATPPAVPRVAEVPAVDDVAPARLRAVTAALKPLAANAQSFARRGLAWVTSSRPRMLGTIGAAAATVAVVALIASLGGEDAPTTSTGAVADVTSAIPASTEPSAKAPASADAENAQPAKAEAKPAAPADEEDAAVVADDAAEAEAAPEPTPKAEPTAKAPAKPAAHEGIVFAPRVAPKRSFRAAAKQCEDMNAASEVTDWRLPTLGELHILSIAHVIERGAYWSGTEADGFGERALVWNEKKTTAAPITKAWKGARALCVRDQRAP